MWVFSREATFSSLEKFPREREFQEELKIIADVWKLAVRPSKTYFKPVFISYLSKAKASYV